VAESLFLRPRVQADADKPLVRADFRPDLKRPLHSPETILASKLPVGQIELGPRAISLGRLLAGRQVLAIVKDDEKRKLGFLSAVELAIRDFQIEQNRAAALVLADEVHKAMASIQMTDDPGK